MTSKALRAAASNCCNTMTCERNSALTGAAYMRSSFSRHAMAERYLNVLLDEAIAPAQEPEALRAATA